MMDDATPPRELLQWVRVRGMHVFWPALVYESYSEMSRQSHDVSALRNSKPALDDEDRVVYFFGITNSSSSSMSSGSYSSSVVPNLRFCVVPYDELTEFPWEGAGEFDKVCRTHNIAEDMIVRAQKNSTFNRACKHAAQFDDEAYDTDDASRVLMSFLTGALTTTTNPSPTKPTKPAPTKSASPAKQTPTPTKPTKTSPTKRVAPVAQKLPGAASKSPTTLSARLTSACWQQMEAAGWATLAQPDGSQLFTMPGVSFFDLRPNVTVFDSLATACARFLALWLESTNENDALEALLWGEMAASGWQTLQSTNETWFSMPNTPFDRFVPNETIFQSKRLAIAKFLQSTGLTGSGEATEEVTEEEEEEEELSSSESEADEEEEEEEEAYAQIHKSVVKSRAVRSMKEEKPAKEEKPRRALQKKTKRASSHQQPQRVVVPPFKCTQGKIEMELKARGWYWVPHQTKTDNWMYCRPHCRGKELSELEVGEDCFPGRVALDSYLEMTGLYSEIVEKLRRDHEHAFLAARAEAEASTAARASLKSYTKKAAAAHDEDDVIEISGDESENDGGKTARKVTTRETAVRVSARTTEAARGAARRKPATSQVKRRRAPMPEIKFGHIWAKLATQGWYYRDNALGYHYYRPTSKTKAEMVAEEDFFTTKESVIDFLKESGIWYKVASEIEDERRAESESTPLKRKPSESSAADGDEARTPTAKKAKTTDAQTTDDFQTPPTKRASELEIPETQDLSKLESTPLISPESNAPAKSKQDGTPLARNLNDAFTPSPRVDKRSVGTKKAETHELSPRELAQEAITRLSLGFQPESFTHRDAEAKQIKDFCRQCFTERRGGSLYLSGSPGCGKSALLRSLGSSIGELKQKFGKGLNEIVPAHLNAMGLGDFNQLFCQLAEILTGHEYVDGEEAFEAIERGTDASLKRSKVLLLVLDEIDALGKKPSMENDLCRLFELANRSTHTFILVGIANQMDFTERHLASLRVQLPDIKPQVIVFKPYSFQTISDILTDRLGGEANAAKLMNTNGIAFIARKVAAQSGDVRLALDICRRVLQQKLNDNAASDAHHVLHSFTSPIPLMDIVKTIKVVLDSKSKSNVSSLPRNLQMILFASTRLVAQHSSTTAASDSSSSASSHTLYQVEDLYESYCDVSHDAGVFKPLSRGEFKLGLETLSSEGMIGASELKKQLIKLVCTPSELLQTFKHDAYFSRLI